jgi:membrane fusion protein (multidrug efflux system)
MSASHHFAVATTCPSWRRAAFAAAALCLGLLAACSREPAPGSGPGGGPTAPPPPEVGVVTVTSQAVGLVTELPGRLEASRVAQVRARAAGILQERLFQEGSDVRAGQPLFRIDPAPYRAAVQSAEAQLARAQAQLGQASALVERFKPLAEAHAVSRQEYVNAVAAHEAAQADVAAGRAAVTTARINLGHAMVTSPIAGRIGRALVTEGALVGQGEATPLAVVQQIQPMYVNFTQPASEVLRLRHALAEGRLRRASGPEAARVQVLLDDGSVYGHAGRLLFSDLSVDQTSGQITLRAELPNPENLLLPGLYVRVRLEQAEAQQAMLLPQQAVQRSTQGDSVMVVGADGKVAPRPVKVGSAQGGQWVVLDGLKPGEQVMVDGFQKLRGPGPVKPVPWPGPAASGPGRSPASGAPAAAENGKVAQAGVAAAATAASR